MNGSKTLIFERILRLDAPDAFYGEFLAFWRGHGFDFDATHGETVIARRGTFWGNLTSFDMSRLIATLMVTRPEPDEIQFVLAVNTVMQIISEWDNAYFVLEMDIAESILRYGDTCEQDWEDFDRAWRKAAWGSGTNLKDR